MISAKENVHLNEEFISYVVHLFIKENADHMMISPQKRVVNFSYAILLLNMQMAMVILYWNDKANPPVDPHALHASNDSHGSDWPYYAPKKTVSTIRFLACIALFLFIHPNIDNGLAIMKFASN